MQLTIVEWNKEYLGRQDASFRVTDLPLHCIVCSMIDYADSKIYADHI